MANMNKLCSHCRKTMKKEIPGVFRCKCGTVWMKDKGYFQHEPGTEYYLAEASVHGTTVYMPRIRKVGQPEEESPIELELYISGEPEKEQNTAQRPSGPYYRTAEQIVYGGIYYIRKQATEGHEQHKGRPGIVVSSVCEGNYNNVVTVVLLTRSEKPLTKTRARITSSGEISTVLIEQVDTVDISRIGDFMGKVTPKEMIEVKRCLLNHFRLTDCALDITDKNEYIRRLEGDVQALESQLREQTSLAEYRERQLRSLQR